MRRKTGLSPTVITTNRPKAVLSLRFHLFYVCVCNQILVTMFPEWLMEPWPRTPGAVRPSSSCL